MPMWEAVLSYTRRVTVDCPTEGMAEAFFADLSVRKLADEFDGFADQVPNDIQEMSEITLEPHESVDFDESGE